MKTCTLLGCKMNTSKCLIEGCNNMSAATLKRGLCMQCYSKAKKMVDNGITSWLKLVSLGLSLGIDGIGSTDPFVSAYNKATEEIGANNH